MDFLRMDFLRVDFLRIDVFRTFPERIFILSHRKNLPILFTFHLNILGGFKSSFCIDRTCTERIFHILFSCFIVFKFFNAPTIFDKE